jgi:urea transport system substrate-binding protein
VDPGTQHTWRSASIGRIGLNGQFEVVWTAQKPIRPSPFPLTRSRAEWETMLEEMQDRSMDEWLAPPNNRF